MKRVISFIIAILMLCLFSVSVFAYEVKNDTWMENGDTYLGVFKVKGTEYEDFFRRWKSSNKNMFYIENNSGFIYYRFCILSDGLKVSFDYKDSSKLNLVISGVGVMDELVFYSDSSHQITLLNFYSLYNQSDSDSFSVSFNCFTGTYFSSLPSECLPFLPKCEGNLILVDDLDGDPDIPINPPDGGGGGSGDEGGEGGILDWIGGFFTNLWDFFVKLIVPDAEYFSNWFEEIKNAAMEKLGPVGDIFGALGDLFGSLENDTTSSSLILDIPRNHFFQGFDGVRVDLLESGKDIIAVVKGFLTACMVLLTCIVCYKRIIVLFEGDV